MAESLIIRLGSDVNESVHWLVWSESSAEIIASGELESAKHLEQLAEKALHRTVTVVVPASDVTFKQLNVPAKSARAMKMAAPFMLEDDLAQDVENIFFAYGAPKIADNHNNCFLVAVDRKQMNQWLSWLTEAGIHTKKMLPDALLLPEHDDSWSCVELSNNVMLKQGAWSATTVERSLFDVLLNRWQALTNDDECLKLHCYSPLNVPSFEQKIAVVNAPEELPLAMLAKSIPSNSFNLLQGEFQVKEQRSPAIKLWLAAASFAALALVTNIGFKSLQLWQINSQQAALEQQIIGIYKDAFPETKRVRMATIRSQLKRKMAEVGRSAEDNHFLAMLNKLEPAFSQVSQLKPETLKFDGKRNEIRLQAIGTSYQDFERFKTSLEKMQFDVSQGAQNNNGDSISGSFSISMQSSRSQ